MSDTILVYATAGRQIPIPTGVCVGGRGSRRNFPVTPDDAIEVYAAHRFIRRMLREPKAGPDRSSKAPALQADLTIAKKPSKRKVSPPAVKSDPAKE